MDNDVAKAVLQFRGMQAAMGNGCHDGYCVIEKPKGMHTNGGCYCMDDLTFQQKQYIGHMLKCAQVMAAHLEKDND